MNLLCPNCQKPLSVPEQYAGQPMRCPLCAGTFTVPALPQSSAPPPPPPSPPPPEPRLAPPPPDVYAVHDAAPPPPPPVMDLPEVQIIPDAGKPPAPRAPGAPAAAFTEEQPTYPDTPPPEGYQRKHSIWFSPKVLQYVAPVSVFLVFVLSFFAWTGVYPGGVAAVTQNMWQAAFWGYSVDTDVGNPFSTKEEERGVFGIRDVMDVPQESLDKLPQESLDKLKEAEVKPAVPGLNILLLFYFLLFLLTLLVTAGCLALVFVPASALPPTLHPFLPWRWGLVAVLNLILLLFLVMQMVFGFSLENNFIGAADSAIARNAPPRPPPRSA